MASDDDSSTSVLGVLAMITSVLTTETPVIAIITGVLLPVTLFIPIPTAITTRFPRVSIAIPSVIAIVTSVTVT